MASAKVGAFLFGTKFAPLRQRFSTVHEIFKKEEIAVLQNVAAPLFFWHSICP